MIAEVKQKVKKVINDVLFDFYFYREVQKVNARKTAQVFQIQHELMTKLKNSRTSAVWIGKTFYTADNPAVGDKYITVAEIEQFIREIK